MNLCSFNGDKDRKEEHNSGRQFCSVVPSSVKSNFFSLGACNESSGPQSPCGESLIPFLGQRASGWTRGIPGSIRRRCSDARGADPVSKAKEISFILLWYFVSLGREGFTGATDPLVQCTTTRLSAQMRRKEGACGIRVSGLVCQTHIHPQEDKRDSCPHTI